MAATNRHGLSRHIPDDITLEIRRRSKFGCVMCRCAIYQYEHIEPKFADARAHDPQNICLLCGGCHDRVTRGRLSKASIRDAYRAIQEDVDIRPPFEELDLSTHNIRVGLGTAMFEHARHLIRINGVDLLSITPPSAGARFPTLNGLFCDRSGREIFRIRDNVWEGPSDAWDIAVVGSRVVVKTEGGRTALIMTVTPPDGVVINQLDMYVENCHVTCDDSGLRVGRVHGTGYAYIGVGGFTSQGAEVGVEVDARDVDVGGPPIVQSIQIVGGEGITLVGAGIRLGVGSGAMTVRDLKVWNR